MSIASAMRSKSSCTYRSDRRGPRRPPPSLPQNRIAPAKPALERRLLRHAPRRRALGALRLVAGGVLALLGSAGPVAAQASPRAGGELIFVVPAEPPSYDAHREETFAVMHPAAPHYNTLLRVDPTDRTGTKDRRGPRRVLDGRRGRPDVHVQPPPRRQVPRRQRADLEGRQGLVRQDHLPARRRGVEPQGRSTGRSRWSRPRIPTRSSSA